MPARACGVNGYSEGGDAIAFHLLLLQGHLYKLLTGDERQCVCNIVAMVRVGSRCFRY